MPITVTFDTNTLASVVSPEKAQRGTGPSGAAVRAAIDDGLIQGFFWETLITLEGIERKDRRAILGKTRVISEASSCGPNNITLTIGVRHVRKPVHPRFCSRVQGAVKLGMRALMAPARIGGGFHVKGETCPLFEPTGVPPALWQCMDKVNDMATRIARHG